MQCPYCCSQENKVIDSRIKSEGKVIRRRRECISCSKRFTTKEYLEETPLLVVKADHRREAFNREKLKKGIQIACTKRPISSDNIDNILLKIEQSLRENSTDEINSTDIGLQVMTQLRKVDQVAYVRFASVYRNFQDKEQFLTELNEL